MGRFRLKSAQKGLKATELMARGMNIILKQRWEGGEGEGEGIGDWGLGRMGNGRPTMDDGR
jgi:hypothetical protein